MGRRRKKRGGRNRGLNGTPPKDGDKRDWKGAGLQFAALIGGGFLGNVIGKPSVAIAMPILLYGVWQKKTWLLQLGGGMCLGYSVKREPAQATQTDSEVNGFDIKQIAEGAKGRAMDFFHSFAEKLYIPASVLPSGSSGETTQGLDDQVTYFVNPYGNKELDMSALDKVQEQIAQMNSAGMTGLSDIDREF